MAEMLDLENSFEELKILPIADFTVLPINADLDKFESKIRRLKFPLWIKLNSWEHKTKINAVKKCYSFEELKKTHGEFKKQFEGKKFIVQKDVSGVEIIAGLQNDRTFGKVLLLGTGGSLAEVIKDTTFIILPAVKSDIETALKELKIFPLLQERNCNIEKLVELIKKFSELKIEEAGLNPIVVNEKNALIIDARLRLEDS